MKTPLVQPAAPTPTASVSEFIATFAVILAAIVGLLLVDTALAKVDSTERKAVAAREYRAGSQLLTEGSIKAAVEHLRTAATLDAQNPAYATALAEATLADGRPDAAEQMLLPVLERYDTAGAPNLAMARVLMKEGRIDEAESYYHRAIYARWPRGANQSAVARFELIDVLAGTASKHDLLAELLPIQDDSTVSIAQRKHIAHLFVTAGSPARAIAIFRDVLKRDPRDADAYQGLAEAALSVGDFSTARADLLAAQKLVPEDSATIQSRISVIDTVVTLDPTQRGLSMAEQYRRAKNLVQMTLASVRKCLGAQSPEVAALDSTGSTLVSSAAAAGQAQSIDQTLLLAEQLWTLQRGKCTAAPKPGALALVQNRLAQ